ncbi:hypothetical protein JKP88DRAFT_242229 [Tribonema minus]|uniref:Uncharacterized protein n=1 Tax=Tribonema minus TaxID=303371 RepID=A0A836C9L1_9STRA|nr:hypothetical protein JKP88DRAFT_242229 [Tribonema minus]
MPVVGFFVNGVPVGSATPASRCSAYESAFHRLLVGLEMDGFDGFDGFDRLRTRRQSRQRRWQHSSRGMSLQPGRAGRGSGNCSIGSTCAICRTYANDCGSSSSKGHNGGGFSSGQHNLAGGRTLSGTRALCGNDGTRAIGCCGSGGAHGAANKSMHSLGGGGSNVHARRNGCTSFAAGTCANCDACSTASGYSSSCKRHNRAGTGRPLQQRQRRLQCGVISDMHCQGGGGSGVHCGGGGQRDCHTSCRAGSSSSRCTISGGSGGACSAICYRGSGDCCGAGNSGAGHTSKGGGASGKGTHVIRGMCTIGGTCAIRCCSISSKVQGSGGGQCAFPGGKTGAHRDALVEGGDMRAIGRFSSSGDRGGGSGDTCSPVGSDSDVHVGGGNGVRRAIGCRDSSCGNAFLFGSRSRWSMRDARRGDSGACAASCCCSSGGCRVGGNSSESLTSNDGSACGEGNAVCARDELTANEDIVGAAMAGRVY